MKLGIIGVGAIGSFLIEELEKTPNQNITIHAISDVDQTLAKTVQQKSKSKPIILSTSDLISECDLIVEAAHPNCVEKILEKVIKQNKSLLVLSIGGLLDCIELTNYKKLYLPSGAIGGVDLISAAAQKEISEIVLQTTKSPQSLGLTNQTQKETIFEGTVFQAVKEYPKNVNVAARLALAANDPEKVTVRIVVDPAIKRNQHEVFVTGAFGNAYFKIENLKSPDNPKTSYLACLSAIQKLKEISN